MTYREKLYREHPELSSPKIDITKFACPDSYGYEDYSECDGLGGNCEACWDREIPEVEKS